MTKNIAIIGFMAVGKTTVAKRLAMKIGYEAVDLDDRVTEQLEMSIAEIFETFGEGYFREVEHEQLKQLTDEENIVLSTGGGTVLREANRAILREKFFLICLTSKAEVILERVTKDGGTRPLLKNAAEPLAHIDTLLSEREEFYQQADLYVDTSDKSIDEIVLYILEKLKEQK